MTFPSCPLEKEVAQALKDGHWPQGCAQELRAHVEVCGNCSDLVLVTQTLGHSRSAAMLEATSQSPSLLWWRAQLRRRFAASEALSRPVTIAERFALVLILTVSLALVAWQYQHGLHWASWWADLIPPRTLHLLFGSWARVDWTLMLAIPSLAVLALLSGVVFYIVAERS